MRKDWSIGRLCSSDGRCHARPPPTSAYHFRWSPHAANVCTPINKSSRSIYVRLAKKKIAYTWFPYFASRNIVFVEDFRLSLSSIKLTYPIKLLAIYCFYQRSCASCCSNVQDWVSICCKYLPTRTSDRRKLFWYIFGSLLPVRGRLCQQRVPERHDLAHWRPR